MWLLQLAWSCVALVAHARTHNTCTTANFGYMAGAPIYLPVTYLTPGISDWKVSVPMPPPDCITGHVTGGETLVCDADAPPYVSIMDDGVILVHRTGRLLNYASVNVILYCVMQGYMPFNPPVLSNRWNTIKTEVMPVNLSSTSTLSESSSTSKPSLTPTSTSASTSSPQSTWKSSPADTTLWSEESTEQSEVIPSLDESLTLSEEDPMVNRRIIPADNSIVMQKLRRSPPKYFLLPYELFEHFVKFWPAITADLEKSP